MAAAEVWVRQDRLSKLVFAQNKGVGVGSEVHFPNDRGKLQNAISIGLAWFSHAEVHASVHLLPIYFGVLGCHGLNNRGTPAGDSGGDHVAQDLKAVVAVAVNVILKLGAQLGNIVEARPFCLVCVWGGTGPGLRVQRHVAVGVLLTPATERLHLLEGSAEVIGPAPCNGGGAGCFWVGHRWG